MNDYKNNEEYLREVKQRIRIQQYEKFQLEKIQQNKKLIKRIEIKTALLIFISSFIISGILYILFDAYIVDVYIIIIMGIFLTAACIYENYTYLQIKNKV